MMNYNLEESAENFNDMSTMQDMDSLIAVCYVLNILKDNGIVLTIEK